MDDLIATPNKIELAKISRDFGGMATAAILTVVLNDLIDFFNIGENNMNAAQLAYTIRLIQTDYYYLTLEDFKLFSDNAKRGNYGKSYNRMDGAILFEWLGKYADDRQCAFMEKHDQDGAQFRDNYPRHCQEKEIGSLINEQKTNSSYRR